MSALPAWRDSYQPDLIRMAKFDWLTMALAPPTKAMSFLYGAV